MSTALRPLLASSTCRLLPPLALVGSNGGGVRFKSITPIAEARRERMTKPVAKPTGKKERKRLMLLNKGPPPPVAGTHGERFWINCHIATGMTLYSLTPEIKKNKTMRTQAMFTGKKLCPASLRKDYWRTIAVVDVGAGNGIMGRSVFHKMREFKQRHLLEWGPQAGELLQAARRGERGRILNDQRANTVADLAAVLGGAGKGNLIVQGTEKELRWVKWTDKNGKAVGGEMKLLKPKQAGEAAASSGGSEGADAAVVAAGEADKPAAEGGDAKQQPTDKVQLRPATVYWANEQDRFYAREWTANVSHVLGLPERDAAENVARDKETAQKAEDKETRDALVRAAQRRKAEKAEANREKYMGRRMELEE